jgi:histidinol phosphatase-like enzyme
VAAKHGAHLRCVWFDTPLEDAQRHACLRLVDRYGELPGPEALSRLARTDPHALGPTALFRFQRELEPPEVGEGFDVVERRELPPPRVTPSRRGLLVDLDGGLWSSKSGAKTPRDAGDLVVPPDRALRVASLGAAGVPLAAIAWLPGLSTGALSEASADAMIGAVREAVGEGLAVRRCPHPPGPPKCWCRKPLPGLGVALSRSLGVEPSAWVVVGDSPAAAGFARRLGATFRGSDFWADRTPWDAGGPARLW